MTPEHINELRKLRARIRVILHTQACASGTTACDSLRSLLDSMTSQDLYSTFGCSFAPFANVLDLTEDVHQGTDRILRRLADYPELHGYLVTLEARHDDLRTRKPYTVTRFGAALESAVESAIAEIRAWRAQQRSDVERRSTLIVKSMTMDFDGKPADQELR